MAWTLPDIPLAGTIATVAGWATKIVNCFRYLKGLDGVPTVQSGLIVDNSLGTEYVTLPKLTTAQAATALAAEGKIAHDNQTHRIKLHDGTAVRSVVTTVDVDDTPVDAAATDPISSNWAYDFINTLTAQADIPYATAAGVWARLAKGTGLQALRMNAGATAPEWSTPVSPSVVRKTANETVNNSAALQSDDHLLKAMLANEVWEYTFLLRYLGTAAAGITVDIIGPVDSVFNSSGIGQTFAGTTAKVTFFNNAGSGAGFNAAATVQVLVIKGIVVNGANAGNLQLQWAQGAAEVSDLTVLANSCLIAHQLA